MYRCYCDAVSQCNTPHSAIPLTVQYPSQCNTPSQSGQHHIVVNSTHLTSQCPCLPVIVVLSGPMNLLKTVCAIDKVRFWGHCYHSVSFTVVVWSPSGACLALDKMLCMCAAPPRPPKLILQGACLLFVQMSQIFHILTSDSYRIDGTLWNDLLSLFLCFHNNN